MKEKVSVIVPTYNVEKYIVPCLHSVAKQTYSNIECIIVDDCGTDSSIEKVQDFISSYSGPISYVICHRETNGGLSAARNSGMEIATGDYLYFLDSDDLLFPDTIENLMSSIGSCDVCVGGHKVITDNQITSVFSDRILIENKIVGRRNVIDSYVNGYWPVMAWNKLIRSSFVKRHKLTFQEGLIHEDEMWTFHLLLHMENISLCSYQTYQYRHREGSIMTVENPKNRKDLALILRTIITYIYETGDMDMMEYGQYMYKFVSIALFSNKISLADNKECYKTISHLPLRMKGNNCWGKLLSFGVNHYAATSFWLCYVLAGLRKRSLIMIK